MRKTSNNREVMHNRCRHGVVLCAFLIVGVLIGVAAVDLQYFQQTRLVNAGEDRHFRTTKVSASRGNIVDRKDSILAVSMPAYAVWADPQQFDSNSENTQRVADLIGMPHDTVAEKIRKASERRFVYLRRRLPPEVKEQLMAADIRGIGWTQEYRRYYPLGEASAHLLGFTDVDGKGLEGAELAFDKTLRGKAGARRVLCDINGREIEDISEIQAARHGRNIKLALDSHIQYRAWRALKDAVTEYQALSGSAVMLDVRTGDVLAMANYPGVDPHKRESIKAELVRNRAAVDGIEPGSTMKPFIVGMLLDNRHANIDTGVATSPGYYRYKGYEVRDLRDFGYLTIEDVLVHSSNVGISKLAQRLSPETMWASLRHLGFSDRPLTGFPGEAAGFLRHYEEWSETSRMALSYGYGLQVSPLQLARAYAAIANDGLLPEVQLIARADHVQPRQTRVFSREVASRLRRMLENVVVRGSGKQAKAHGYTTAGKTGTVRKHARGVYADDAHISLFAGFAPAARPRIALVVVIDEPRSGQYLGGIVAAPVFAQVVTSTLRYLRVPEDETSADLVYRMTRRAS